MFFLLFFKYFHHFIQFFQTICVKYSINIHHEFITTLYIYNNVFAASDVSSAGAHSAESSIY